MVGRLILACVVVLVGCGYPSRNQVPPNNFVVGNKFIKAFYSFNRDSLQAVLSSAESSRPEILYYQKWAECAHYEVLDKTHNFEINDSTLALPITVKDDLIAALGIDFHVTDTFKLIIREGQIRSVETSSNDPAEYYRAKEWVKNNRLWLIEKPCEGIWAGGPTPCECVLGMIKGFGEFRDATDPNRRPKSPLYIEESDLNVTIDTISSAEFDLTKIVHYEKPRLNGDSLVRALADQYNDVIVLADSCLILKGFDKDIRLCRQASGDEKTWTHYEGINYDHGYLIVAEIAYESWSTVCFNPKTRRYVITSSEPQFITNDLIYSVDNTYGAVEFQLVDAKHGKKFGFIIDNAYPTGYYQQGNSIFIGFNSHETNDGTHYLRITF